MSHSNLAALAAVFALPLIGDAPRAQEEEEVGDRAAVEEIVVTGSRIKRRDFNSPSPITTIGRDKIATSAEATLEGLLNNLPQVSPHVGRASNNPGNGKSHVDLRGVGPGRTLVMLNARRFAPSGVGNAVDLNSIPQALIERVEVITGGASTVYGSDALAGVVNFVTRDDFDGLSIEGYYGLTEKGDAAAADLSIAWGTDFADSRGNVALYAGYYDREELFAGEREFSRYAWAELWDTGELIQGGSFRTPRGAIFAPQYDFGNGPDFVTFTDDGVPRPLDLTTDRYNFAPVNYLQVPLERISAGLLGSYEFNNGYELYVESTFAANDGAQELAAVPAGASFVLSSDNPLFTPETIAMLQDGYEVAPGLAAAFVAKRINEVGPRHIATETDYWRTAAGVRGTMGGSWDIDAWVTYTKVDESEFLLNDGSASRVAQAMLVDPLTGQCLDPSNGCVPLSFFGIDSITPEAANFIRVPAMTNTTERNQQLAALVVTGTPFEWYAGPIDVAAGLEWRRDEVFFEADAGLFTGDTLGYRGDAPVNGTESVSEIYFEGIVPLYEEVGGAGHLELEFGGRYSRYDHAGGVWTYKIGSSWQINNALRLRAMHQHAVRAPNNLELFQEQFTELVTFVIQPDDDPCSASQDPVGNGVADKCVIQGLSASQIGIFEATPGLAVDNTFGGNPDLVPESADTLTAGLVITLESLPNWDFAVDYFEMDLEDGIGEIDAYNICFDVENTSNLFCDRLQRGPTGELASVLELFNNRGLFSTSGVDLQVRYGGDAPGWLGGDRGHQLNVDLVWTHTMSLDSQENPVSSVLDCLGFFGSECAGLGGTAPENRVSANFGYSTANLNVLLSTVWVDGTDNWGKVDYKYFGGPPAMLAIPSIGSQFYADLSIAYQFSDNLSASFGIANLLDRDPPMMAGVPTGNNTDTGLYDIFGRAYRVTFSYRVGN